MTQMIIVIGRGHSGTRLISQTLHDSGVFMGALVNSRGDKILAKDGAKPMYKAARIVGKLSEYKGNFLWDYSRVFSTEPTEEYRALVGTFVDDILESDRERVGWKLPETLLSFPWIVKMFPDAYYIHWVRDPRDCAARYHVTDYLGLFNIPFTLWARRSTKRVASWLYQENLVHETPKPGKFITIRFEDFVLNQDEELKRLQEFLGFELKKLPVRADRVYQWKKTGDKLAKWKGQLREAIERSGYEAG